jgi:hypothetical protein
MTHAIYALLAIVAAGALVHQIIREMAEDRARRRDDLAAGFRRCAQEPRR